MTQDRLSLARLFILPAAALLAQPSIATAGVVRMYNYNCNIGGAPARLTSRVETIRGAGLVRGRIIPTPDVSYVYEGELVSRTAHYYFTGRDAFADFVDAGRRERFRVQFVHQGNNRLIMIANPQGPGPAQYLCQLAR